MIPLTPLISFEEAHSRSICYILIASFLLAQLLAGSPGLLVASSLFDPLQFPLQEDNHEIDIITGSDYNGLTTFANLPYSNCFREHGESYDIAILGAPFDTVSKLSPITRVVYLGAFRGGSYNMVFSIPRATDFVICVFGIDLAFAS